MTNAQRNTAAQDESFRTQDASISGSKHSRSSDLLENKHAALLSHYHDLEKLGHGAQATMLKALDAQNHPVAIKVFDYSKAGDWKDVELFEREIEVLKTLEMDGIPRYIETIKTDNAIYLVEQYIDAHSLEHQMKHGRIFSIEECVTILEKTAKILQKLSDHIPPIVHRDIKPANLLVDKNLNVYLVDFGVVANTAQTFSMTFAGTAGYVAPEQLYGKTTPASDIYSLGATMLHLISRVAPCDMQLKGITPDFDKYFPDTVPKWLADLIKDMMSVDLAERPQNGTELSKIINKNHKHHPIIAVGRKKRPAQIIKKYRKLELFKIISGVMASVGILGGCVFGSAMFSQTSAFFPTATLVCIIAFLVFVICLWRLSSASSQIIKQQGLSIYDEDVEKAFAGGAKSQYLIGQKYDYGNGIQQDKEIASEWYLLAAEKGNAEAQFCLGYKYQHGEGVKQDIQEAAKWYTKAAEQGVAGAQYNLGWMYDNGDGIAQDKQEAIKWYTKAAEQGHANAQCNLGCLYDEGNEIVQDKQEAIKWYTKAADQGQANAQYNLGCLYDNGDGIAQDKQEAIQWYKKAAEQGHAKAQYNLGCMYENGDGVAVNKQLAADWYKKAALQNYMPAQFHIGDMYTRREGVEQANDKYYCEQNAIRWYREAADQGHAESQYRLGAANEKNGLYTMAKNEYEKAAKQGHVKAQFALARLYQHHTGVGIDLNMALKWYTKAAEQEHAEAQYCLAQMYDLGNGPEQNKSLAVKWYSEAARQGHTESRFQLAQKYETGDGVTQDIQTAITWYQMAAEKGCIAAQNALWEIYKSLHKPDVSASKNVNTAHRMANTSGLAAHQAGGADSHLSEDHKDKDKKENDGWGEFIEHGKKAGTTIKSAFGKFMDMMSMD